MLTIHKCRKLVGADCDLTDKELEQLRNQFYCLASLALEERDRQKKFLKVNGSVIDRHAVEERAAIIEFEGNVSRDKAERDAVALALENDHLN